MDFTRLAFHHAIERTMGLARVTNMSDGKKEGGGEGVPTTDSMVVLTVRRLHHKNPPERCY